MKSIILNNRGFRVLNQIQKKIANSRVYTVLNILSKREKKFIFLILTIQIVLGIMDLVGVMLVGLIAAISVTGVSNSQLGDRTSSALGVINLENSSLQTQAAVLGILAAGFLIGKTLFSLYFTRKSLFFLSKRSATISAGLIMKLLNQSLMNVQEKSRQQTVYSLTNGVNTVTVNIIGTSITLISDAALLLILITGLFVVDTLIAVSALMLYGSIGVLLFYLMQVKVRALGKRQSKMQIASAEKMYEVLTSYRELFVRNRRHYYAELVGGIRFSLANAVAESAFLVNVSKYVMEFTVIVGGLLVAVIQFSTHTVTYALTILTIFLAASTRIAPAVLRIQQGVLSVKSNLGVSEPTLELIDKLNQESAINKPVNELDFSHNGFTGCASLENLSFKYLNQKELALSEVNLEIEHGELVALVGPSGAGKTTLIDLMIGVLEPSNGKVRINGVHPVDAIQLWTGAIAYVPQDIVIVNGSIKENILLGFPDTVENLEYVNLALQSANLSEFVNSLSEGVNYLVGDGGNRLSGGQRQRLGIARALFTQPSFLILDEATSSLDAESEESISESIKQIRSKTTVVIIAHRLSTVKNADKVVYLEGGKILSIGSFEEVRKRVPNFEKQAFLMGL
jgi:ABC-type multidrug transport system fused ATPase/permease subunit